MGAVRLIFIALLVLAACSAPQPPRPDGGTDGGDPMVCDVVLPEECSPAGMALTFNDVKPAFETHCGVCHYGAVGGPWPLTAYNDVVDWAPIVRDTIGNCTMPPSDAGTNMTTAEKHQILDWLRCGYPR